MCWFYIFKGKLKPPQDKQDNQDNYIDTHMQDAHSFANSVKKTELVFV